MPLALMQALQAQQTQAFPSYFNPVVLLLLLLGALGWLVACALGFTRAGSGPGARWFALAAACMLLFHLHILVIGIAGASGAGSTAVALTAFVPLFVVLSALCAVVGFLKTANREPSKAVSPEP